LAQAKGVKRDSEGAERCITTTGASGSRRAGTSRLMFSAATDHRYLTTGHVLDFTNNAFEALDPRRHVPSALIMTILAVMTVMTPESGAPAAPGERITEQPIVTGGPGMRAPLCTVKTD